MTDHSPPAPIGLQKAFWNGWNTEFNEIEIRTPSRRQAQVILGWLEAQGRQGLDLIDVGCGSGWLCPMLAGYGRVTGTDLSDEVLERARLRNPQVTFLAGDFMTLDLPLGTYDVVTSLEVLAHVADQPAFVARVAALLRPGGLLMLATQNRPVLEKYNRIAPPAEGQLRRWVDRHELRHLLAPHFEVQEIFSVHPQANRGLMRLLHSRTLNRPIRALAGDRVDRFKERIGLGWSLMALARKPMAGG